MVYFRRKSQIPVAFLMWVCHPGYMHSGKRQKIRGFSLLELMLSLGAIGILAVAVVQDRIGQAEEDTAGASGLTIGIYSNGVAAYIADQGTGIPAGTLTGYNWLRNTACGGSAPNDYIPCDWNPNLPFGIQLTTEVIHATGAPGDPCPDPVGHVCAETRISVPNVNGNERLDLAAEMLHSSQGATVAVRSTHQDYRLADTGEMQITTRGKQSPPFEFLTVDGDNVMLGALDMGDHDITDNKILRATGDLTAARFIDTDDPSFIMDPAGHSTLQDLHQTGDLNAVGGGNLQGLATFGDGADIAAAATFGDDVDFREQVNFTGGQTDFNSSVSSSGSAPAHFTVARVEGPDGIADFISHLEIRGTAAIGDACNATQENLRFNSAQELLECVGGRWQYAGIDTKKASITYYDLRAANGYGEFHWAGNGIGIPGKHHLCSSQSIEGTTLARGGGARVETASGPDSVGRRSFQYIAHQGVEDSETIPLVLQSGERNVLCMTFGPEPTQGTVSTVQNTAPVGSVSCTDGYVGSQFDSYLSVSDPDDPLLYQWTASGRCSILHANETYARIQRSGSPGTCTIRVRVTDYYNAARTISDSCQVRPIPQPTVDGVCSCTTNQCTSGNRDLDPDEPDPPDPPDPLPPGWTPPPPPPERWTCEGRRGGSTIICTEGSSCPSPVNGSCSGTINRCSNGSAAGYTRVSGADQTAHRWTCRGHAGGSNASCEVINYHPTSCDPVADRVNGACGTNLNTCNAGFLEAVSNQSWLCRGRCGGTDADCDVTVPPPTPPDGACGDALNTCANGTYQYVPGSTWNCLAPNPPGGGIDALGCEEVVHGTCRRGISTVPGDCISGTASGTTNPWTCQGIGGGVDVECRIGACGTAANTCAVGGYENITGGTSWRCKGNIDLTTLDEPVCVVAECGDTQGSCDVGTPSGNTNPWTCAGPNGGVEATCAVGLCGTADTEFDGCAQGEWEDIADPPSGIATWNCLGSVDASANDDAPCTDGVGVCGPTQGTCDQGLSSSTITPRWTCEGGNPDPLVTSDDAECYVGVCGDPTSPGNCTEGDPSGFENPYVCKGNYHDDAVTADDDDCFVGVCGTADNAADGCESGTYQFVSGLTWRCMGSDTMSYTDEANCMPVPGLCDYSDAGKCIDGESSDLTGASNPWTCAGTAGAADATCLLAACDINAQGICLTGTPTGTTNPWTCEGGDPDVNITADDDEDCTFGVCDYAGPGRCLQGTPSASGHTWTCEGSWRGSWGAHTDDDMDCIKAQCREGEDGAEDNSLKGCITGQWAHVEDLTDDVAMWRCLGNAADPNVTDDDDDCQVTTTVDIDGECQFVKNSSGQIQYGRCDQGDEPGTNANPTWTCGGINNGDDADCVAGQCPATSADNGTCASGDAEYIPGPNYNDGENWMCKGSDTTSSDDDVTCKPIIYGICGDAIDTCYSGRHSTLPGTAWDCLGSNGGKDKRCSSPIIPKSSKSSGGCGDQENTCLVGVNSYSNNTSVDAVNHGCSVHTVMTIIDMADTPNLSKWQCQYAYTGSCQNGNNVAGSNAVSCDIPTSSCALSNFTWIASCGGGGIDCEGYYETNYDHCIVTNPKPGALYYQDAVGYGVSFIGYTPSDPIGDVTVEYTCCTNCDDLGSPITDPDNDCSWPPVTPVTPVVDGICGTADNAMEGCFTGTYQDEPGDAWTCLGTGGGTDANCPTGCGDAPQIGPNPHTNPYIGCAFYAILRDWQTCAGFPLTDPPSSCATIPQVCGPDDSPTLGCLAGQYGDVPGPSWWCLNAVNFMSGGYTITTAWCPAP